MGPPGESITVQFLGNADNFIIEGNQLSLRTGAETTLKFIRIWYSS